MLNEWGISSEPVQDFAARNAFRARFDMPQGLSNSKEVIGSSRIPFLPIVGFENQSWEKMLKEVQALEPHFVPHRTKEPHKSWSSLCLHGMSSVHIDAPHKYGFSSHEEVPYRWTDISELCPTITQFLKEDLGYKKFFRVRIMRLGPGGYIIPHKDSLTEEENHLGPVNIALNNPEGCGFYMENIGQLPFSTGTVMSLNLYNVHCVYNQSNEPRYHIIVHGKKGSDWANYYFNSYQKWTEINA